MKTVSVQKPRLLFRTAVLCAVLSGLLFSCGEGIRLFPFPVFETTKNELTEPDFENKIAYQFYAPRFEDAQGNFKTKSQKNFHQHQWLENAGSSAAPFFVAASGKQFQYSAPSADLKRILIAESGESRAPPFEV